MYVLKHQPEDFIVDEDLSIPFVGVGEHLWLCIEKRNLTTDVARSILAKAFSADLKQVSYAGKKDRHALTRQWFSLQLPGTAPQVCDEAAAILLAYQAENPLYEGEQLSIITSHVHQKKCQRGCHQGNFFDIRIRCSLHDSTEAKIAQAVAGIESNGYPNYFGEQRFGDNVQGLDDIDKALVALHKKAKRSRLKPRESWACSQARSFLFNEVLKAREVYCKTRGVSLSHVFDGDLMNLQGSHSCFLVEPQDEAERSELIERGSIGDIVPSGPLFGDTRAQPQPQGAMLAMEQAAWALLSTPAQAQLQKLQEAGRRPFLVRPQKMSSERFDAGLRLQFWLPKGAYATECVRSLMMCFEQIS